MSKMKKEARLKIWHKYKKKCAYCGVKLEYESMQVDHIEPLFRGYFNEDLEYMNRKKGSGKIHNLNPSCKSCNASKSTFTLEQWRSEIKKKQNRVRRDVSSFRILERFKLVKMMNAEVIFYFEKFSDGRK